MGSPEGNCPNPMDIYPDFSPTISGQTPGEPLYDFFLPMIQQLDAQYPGLLKAYEFGFSCIEFARLTVELFGGPRCAKIYWVEEYGEEDEEGWTSEWLDHAFVIPVGASKESLAFNGMGLAEYTVGKVESIGKDITEEIYATGWEAYTHFGQKEEGNVNTN